MFRYLTAMEIKKIYNVCINSLKLWETQGILHPIRTPGGHRRYLENELMSAVTSFSARIYGKRGEKVVRKITNLIQVEVSKNENDD